MVKLLINNRPGLVTTDMMFQTSWSGQQLSKRGPHDLTSPLVRAPEYLLTVIRTPSRLVTKVPLHGRQGDARWEKGKSYVEKHKITNGHGENITSSNQTQFARSKIAAQASIAMARQHIRSLP